MKILSLLFVLIALSTSGCSNSGSETSTGGGGDSVLSDAEITSLVYIREEEKLARDVYQVLFEQWGLGIFNTIASSEQNHMDTMLAMLNQYGIADPVTSDRVGVFSDPVLAALYQELVSRGKQGPSQAIEVGIFIEETDIDDLQRAIAESTQPDLDRAYENLLQGSINHLAAFSSQPL
jgi:hypothetical protein